MWRKLQICLGLALLSSGLGLAGARAEAPLLQSLHESELRQLLDEAGLRVLRQQNGGLIAARPGGPEVWVGLSACDSRGRCRFLRLRGLWPIGARPAAREAAERFDQATPVAFVAVEQRLGGAVVLAGRDLWLQPGRTRANLRAELQLSEELLAQVTQALLRADPDLQGYWGERLRGH